MKWIWQAVLGFIAGTVAIVTFQAVTSSAADPPQACIEALDAGDGAIVMYGEAIGLIDDALNMVLDGDFAAAEDAGRQIGALDPLVEEAVADYDRLSKECRG